MKSLSKQCYFTCTYSTNKPAINKRKPQNTHCEERAANVPTSNCESSESDAVKFVCCKDNCLIRESNAACWSTNSKLLQCTSRQHQCISDIRHKQCKSKHLTFFKGQILVDFTDEPDISNTLIHYFVLYWHSQNVKQVLWLFLNQNTGNTEIAFKRLLECMQISFVRQTTSLAESPSSCCKIKL